MAVALVAVAHRLAHALVHVSAAGGRTQPPLATPFFAPTWLSSTLCTLAVAVIRGTGMAIAFVYRDGRGRDCSEPPPKAGRGLVHGIRLLRGFITLKVLIDPHSPGLVVGGIPLRDRAAPIQPTRLAHPVEEAPGGRPLLGALPVSG